MLCGADAQGLPGRKDWGWGLVQAKVMVYGYDSPEIGSGQGFRGIARASSCWADMVWLEHTFAEAQKSLFMGTRRRLTRLRTT